VAGHVRGREGPVAAKAAEGERATISGGRVDDAVRRQLPGPHSAVIGPFDGILGRKGERRGTKLYKVFKSEIMVDVIITRQLSS
jgi:hypothetical protein